MPMIFAKVANNATINADIRSSGSDIALTIADLDKTFSMFNNVSKFISDNYCSQICWSTFAFKFNVMKNIDEFIASQGCGH